jgi:hypothetical protein
VFALVQNYGVVGGCVVALFTRPSIGQNHNPYGCIESTSYLTPSVAIVMQGRKDRYYYHHETDSSFMPP